MVHMLISLILGISLGSAFLHTTLWWISILGGVALCVFITKLPSAKHTLTYGSIIGLVKMLIVISWGWYIFPVEWMGFSNVFIEIVLLVSFWLLSAASLGLGYAIVSFVFWKVHQNAKSWSWIVVIFFFLLADMLGAFLFSLLMSGPGNRPNFQYANGWMGFALAEHNTLLAIAKYGGVYILNIAFGLLVAFFWILLKKKMYLWCFSTFLLIIVTSSITVLSYQSNDDKTIAAVNTSFAREAKITKESQDKRQETYEKIISSLSRNNADYTLWPEDVRLTKRLEINTDVNQYFRNRSINSVIIDSSRLDRNTTTLRSYIYDTDESVTYQFDKGYLVPQGEYVPYIYRIIVFIFGTNSHLSNVLRDLNYQPGIEQSDIYLPPHLPSVLFCFESINPRGIKRLISARESEVPFVAHIVSHAWFQHEPKILWHQLDTMLRVQAVWNQVPIIQSANMAPNKIYTPDGVSKILSPDVAGDAWSISYLKL